MQGNQTINQMIQQIMNSGLKQVAKKVLSSTNPEQVAMKMMDAYVGKNPQYASLWEQAKKMAESGNAKEKAANMFAERGVDIDNVVDSVMKEIK